MRGIAVSLTVIVALGSLLLVVGPAGAGEVLYYRGYFSAEAAEQPLQGFWYRIDPNTIQPAFYYQYRTQPFPLYNRGSGSDRPGQEQKSDSRVTAPLKPRAPVVLFSPVPLPGQYWYQEPGAYAFHTHDLGWPYDNRK